MCGVKTDPLNWLEKIITGELVVVKRDDFEWVCDMATRGAEGPNPASEKLIRLRKEYLPEVKQENPDPPLQCSHGYVLSDNCPQCPEGSRV